MTKGNPGTVKSRLRRLARGLFRFFRTAVVVLLLIGAVLGLFLNKVGLPESIKRRVIAQARAKGMEVQFSRLRLRWYRGIVAEDVQIKGTNELAGPLLFIEQAECPLNPSALRHFDWKMNSLLLRGARLVWPLSVTNKPRHTFVINRLKGELFFQKDGAWNLPSLRGDFHGVKLDLSGTLSNARMFQPARTIQGRKAVASVEASLQQLERLSSQFKFAGGAELRIRFYGDGRNLSTLGGNLYFSVAGVDSPWGAGTNLSVLGQLIPPSSSNDTASADFKLTAEDTLTPWGKASFARLDVNYKPVLRRVSGAVVSPPKFAGETPGPAGATPAPLPVPTNANLTLMLNGLDTRWGRVEHLSLTANTTLCPTNDALVQSDWTVVGQQIKSDLGNARSAQLTATAWQPLTNWMPGLLSTDLRLVSLQTPWGDVEWAQAHASGSLPSPRDFHLFKTNLVWTERMENLPFEAMATLTNIHSPNITAENVSLRLDKGSRDLRLKSSGGISGGEFNFDGQLDLLSREMFFLVSSDVDPQQISLLLSTNSQRWLARYSFQSPPKLQAQGRLVLPSWTNWPPDWNGEVIPTISLAGKLAAGAGAYRDVAFASAQSPFSMTNLLWRMPQLKITRPEGAIEADCTSDLRTWDFYGRLHSQIDVTLAKTFFQTAAGRRAFDLVQFTDPPTIQAEIRGCWLEFDRLSVSAEVAATNFTFRGEAMKDCQTHLEYTNKVFQFTQSQLQREQGERGNAAAITLDLGQQKLYFTNGLSTLNPYVIARAIGQSAIAAIAPYQFDSPPTARVNGAVDLKRKRYEEDLHFDVSGASFHWKQVRAEHLVGRLDWVGQTLALTNLVGGFHTGSAAGNAYFDFTVPHEADFSLKASFTGMDLREIATPFITTKTNKLEGLLSGELIITQANSGDLKSWQGYGGLNLKDGLIWDIPMFGLFSPVLNALVPGLGNSRANEATATFVLTNGVFVTKDLQIRATMMRMELQGSVGLNKRVDARVEAELLRDLPAVGFVISKVFWPVTKLFEYKVTGAVGEPKAEPLYVLPKIILMPFHPFKTLRGLFLEDEKGTEDKKPGP